MVSHSNVHLCVYTNVYLLPQCEHYSNYFCLSTDYSTYSAKVFHIICKIGAAAYAKPYFKKFDLFQHEKEENERLEKLKQKVEAQEEKIKKLRAVQGQADTTRLSNDSLCK